MLRRPRRWSPSPKRPGSRESSSGDRCRGPRSGLVRLTAAIGWQRAAELEALRAACTRAPLWRIPTSIAWRRSPESCRSRATFAAKSYARSLAAVGGVRARARRPGGTPEHPGLEVHDVHGCYRSVLPVGMRRRRCGWQGDLAGARHELRKALATLESTRHLRGAGDAGVAIETQARSIVQLTCRMAGFIRVPTAARPRLDGACPPRRLDHSACASADRCRDRNGFRPPANRRRRSAACRGSRANRPQSCGIGSPPSNRRCEPNG